MLVYISTYSRLIPKYTQPPGTHPTTSATWYSCDVALVYCSSALSFHIWYVNHWTFVSLQDSAFLWLVTDPVGIQSWPHKGALIDDDGQSGTCFQFSSTQNSEGFAYRELLVPERIKFCQKFPRCPPLLYWLFQDACFRFRVFIILLLEQQIGFNYLMRSMFLQFQHYGSMSIPMIGILSVGIVDGP